ncbi:hypothetical protein UAMX_000678 [Candidatus Uabimicrobium amorphum]|nr:hypothetical protein [Candidatus Uabimicrobium amorphum]
MMWLRDQTYLLIGNIPIKDRSVGLSLVKTVVKYYLCHGKTV